MMAKSTFFVYLILIVSFITFSYQIDCVLEGKAKHEGKDEKYSIDLRKLAKTSPYEVKNHGGDWTYKVNFCKQISQQCGTGKDFKAIQEYTGGGDCFHLGSNDMSDIEIKPNGTPDQGAILLYTKGEIVQESGKIRETQITVKCDSSKSATDFKFVDEEDQGNKIIYKFEIEGKEGCPAWGKAPGPDPGQKWEFCGFFNPLCSIGFILTVILIPIIIGYFVIGSVVRKFYMKKEGIDFIIHIHLMKSLPFLVLDGCKLIFGLIKFVIQKIIGIFKKKDSYQSV